MPIFVLRRLLQATGGALVAQVALSQECYTVENQTEVLRTAHTAREELETW